MGDGQPAARGRLVRALIEECWSDQAGLDRMAGMLTPGYVDSLFSERRYRVVHLIDDGRLVAAFLSWSAVRRADQSLVDGHGAYHGRLDGGLVAEDWDAFFPSA
jgi:hypothetical protein